MFPHNKFNLVCKFFCLAPISPDLHMQQLLYIYSLTTILVLIISTLFSFSINVFGEGFIVSSLATSLVYIAGIIGHVMTVLESLSKREEHEHFFEILNELEDIFRFKLRYRTQDCRNRKRLIWKYFLVSIVVAFCFSCYILAISIRDYQGYFWHAILSVIVARIRFIQASIYVDLINFQFDSMNFLMKQISNSRLCRKNRILDIDYGEKDSAQRIFDLKQIYAKLYDLIICYNDAFGWSILTLIVYFSLDITCNLYWLFLAFEDVLDTNTVFESCFVIIPLGFLLFTLSSACSMCSNKNDITRQYVHKMLSCSSHDHIDYLLDAFLLQIYNQPIIIDAKKFFQINLRLLSTVFVSMLGYLIIMIQFQLTENEL